MLQECFTTKYWLLPINPISHTHSNCIPFPLIARFFSSDVVYRNSVLITLQTGHIAVRGWGNYICSLIILALSFVLRLSSSITSSVWGMIFIRFLNITGQSIWEISKNSLTRIVVAFQINYKTILEWFPLYSWREKGLFQV